MSKPLLSFDIWVQAPSRNVWRRMHYHKQSRLKNVWRRHVAQHIILQWSERQIGETYSRNCKGERFRLRFTQLLGKGCKAYDGDNFSTASTLITDALVYLTVFKDDSLKYLAAPVYGVPIRDRSKPCGGVRVEIEEVA